MEFNATFLITTISFLVFIVLMNAILYKPVLSIMEKRENYIKENKNEAELHKKNAEALIEDKNEKLSEAHKKSRDIISSKASAIKEETAKVLSDTKHSTEQYFGEKRDSLVSQKDQTIQNMRFDVKDLANKLTTKLMGEGVEFQPLSDTEVDEVIRKNV